jgi:hypothetical protein
MCVVGGGDEIPLFFFSPRRGGMSPLRGEKKKGGDRIATHITLLRS